VLAGRDGALLRRGEGGARRGAFEESGEGDNLLLRHDVYPKTGSHPGLSGAGIFGTVRESRMIFPRIIISF
jgi:hypothetical protein